MGTFACPGINKCGNLELAPECATGTYILRLAPKELIGWRAAALGPSYGNRIKLHLSIPASGGPPHEWDMRL